MEKPQTPDYTVFSPGDLDRARDAVIEEYGWSPTDKPLLEWYLRQYSPNAFFRLWRRFDDLIAERSDSRYPIRNKAGYFRKLLSDGISQGLNR